MSRGTLRFGWLAFMLLLLGSGCKDKPPDEAVPLPQAQESGADAEKAVRHRFTEIQGAVKTSAADRLWLLISTKCRAEAEESARDNRLAYAEADQDRKVKLQMVLGLSEGEMVKLTGPDMLSTKPFLAKYHELPESEVEKVTVQKDHATVYWLEPDGDHEKTIFQREDGQWKAWLWIPKAAKQP